MKLFLLATFSLSICAMERQQSEVFHDPNVNPAHEIPKIVLPSKQNVATILTFKKLDIDNDEDLNQSVRDHTSKK